MCLIMHSLIRMGLHPLSDSLTPVWFQQVSSPDAVSMFCVRDAPQGCWECQGRRDRYRIISRGITASLAEMTSSTWFPHPPQEALCP